MASLGTDVVVEKLLKKSAKEALDEVDNLFKKSKESYKDKRILEIKEHLDEVLGLIKKEVRVFQGIKYEIKVFDKEIRWSVLDKNDFWKNNAKLQEGVLEFDFNTYGVKGLGQHWTGEVFEVFGERVKKVKAIWKLDTKYPNGESLGHKEFWQEMDNTWDKVKAVQKTTFYHAMSQREFKKVLKVKDFYGNVIVELIK